MANYSPSPCITTWGHLSRTLINSHLKVSLSRVINSVGLEERKRFLSSTLPHTLMRSSGYSILPHTLMRSTLPLSNSTDYADAREPEVPKS